MVAGVDVAVVRTFVGAALQRAAFASSGTHGVYPTKLASVGIEILGQNVQNPRAGSTVPDENHCLDIV